MAQLQRIAPGVGFAWAGFVAGALVFGTSDVARGAQWLVLVAGVVTAGAALAASQMALAHPRRAGALLVVAAAAPTFAAMWLNLVPLVLGAALTTRARSRIAA